MLGVAVCEKLSIKYHLLGYSHTDLDVTNKTDVYDCLINEQPNFVIHLAAMTNVDYCEKNPILTHQVNTLATEYISTACQNIGATLIFVSSIAVFDGEKPSPYLENDVPNPINIYGKSKWEAEKIVEHVPKHYVLRTGWLFGGGKRDKKFVQLILQLAQTRSIIHVVNDKFGSPTYVDDLADGINRLLEEDLPFGTYHLVNAGPVVSRYELAKNIIELKNINTILKPVDSNYFSHLASRPRMEACSSQYLTDWLRPWTKALKCYLNSS